MQPQLLVSSRCMAQMGDNKAALQLLSHFASQPGDIQQGREDNRINVEKCLKIALEKSFSEEKQHRLHPRSKLHIHDVPTCYSYLPPVVKPVYRFHGKELNAAADPVPAVAPSGTPATAHGPIKTAASTQPPPSTRHRWRLCPAG